MTGRSHRIRIAATAGIFVAVFCALALRAFQLTVLDGGRLRERADDQHHQSVSTHARRGAIVDRFGEPLALARESVAVYVQPRRLKVPAGGLLRVANLLELEPDVVARSAVRPAPFVWLKRQVEVDRWEALEDLGIRGIGAKPAWQRVYPHGALAGHLIGFTGIDGQGLEGIEQMLDADLQGGVEALDVERDARGRRIAADDGWMPLPRVGARVELTIDSSIQRVTERELERAVDEYGGVAGSAVVMVPETGEILAMANVPRFDPNHFEVASADRWRNRAVTDFYEPGSTFKAILAAAALDAGVVTSDEEIFCENGRYRVGGRVIHDHHAHGDLMFRDVIAQSSNIGCAKVAARIGREEFSTAIRRFGFGRPTGVDLPGEVAGLVRPTAQWKQIDLATASFGQGIAVTPLQLTRFFAAIANGGRLMRPFVIRRVISETGKVEVGRPRVDAQVMSADTARELTAMLVRVTESGTGRQARVDGFSVAGKTGTAQKVDPETGGYHASKYMSSFIGYVPAEAPELAILVVVDSPRKSTYGGVVAAPVFRKIAEYALARRGKRSRIALPMNGQAEAVAGAIPPPLAEEPCDGVPSFLGLGMREALLRATDAGWRVRVEGSGYVVAQEPSAGAELATGEIALRFGSTAS